MLTGDDAEAHPLPARGRVIVGRASECEIRVADPSVSRRHAALHLGPTIRVEDLGGANGTFVRRREASAERGATRALRRLAGESVGG